MQVRSNAAKCDGIISKRKTVKHRSWANRNDRYQRPEEQCRQVLAVSSDQRKPPKFTGEGGVLYEALGVGITIDGRPSAMVLGGFLIDVSGLKMKRERLRNMIIIWRLGVNSKALS
ncbi:predicted protein [Histoplasma capsulatum var. duboisii H88]|uniref:Predicted protein n=2 Tax=Ajellomyces capsulatus TaxID=5037 RepID=F0URQ8_AJEC8|nr:predicted protein [Histoplasma capsulatum H143]EGC48585.1 predicted protein [Histoplasma capsulatum var. duboisii H88]